MHYCLQTLLAGGEEVEILIINDGSQGQHCSHCRPIYRSLSNDYPLPSIKKIKGMVEPWIRVWQTQQAGHFKVVDSDDWVDVRAYLKF